MFRLRLFIFCAITLGLSAFVLYRLANKPKTIGSVVTGTWSSGGRVLTFLPQGAYWTATVDTSAMLHPVECGRWSEEATGALMRAHWPTGDSSLTSQTQLKLATWQGSKPERIEVMRAVPQATGSFSKEIFSRSTPVPNDGFQQENRRLLNRACHIDIPE